MRLVFMLIAKRGCADRKNAAEVTDSSKRGLRVVGTNRRTPLTGGAAMRMAGRRTGRNVGNDGKFRRAVRRNSEVIGRGAPVS